MIFKFSNNEMTDLLNVNVVPGALSNLWNAVVVNKAMRRGNAPYMPLAASVIKTEYMARFLQNTDHREYIHRGGSSIASLEQMFKEASSYYMISTGYEFSRTGTIEIGTISQGIRQWREHENGRPSVLMRDLGLRRNPAMSISFDYRRTGNMKAEFKLGAMRASAIGRTGHMLGAQAPQTRKQAQTAMLLMGQAIHHIQSGQPVDFLSLRNDLLDIGLQSAGEPNPDVLKPAKLTPYKPRLAA